MFKLALNAGHGINTKGKRCMAVLDKNQTREWWLNARICERIEQKLKNYKDYEVIRLDDPTGVKDIALKKRTNTANNFGATFYLSIHHNAGIKGGKGGGIVTYVHSSPSKESVEWQEALYEALIDHTALKGNRADGTCRANFHECRESKMPCVLLECGFMDSSTDVPIILTDNFAEAVATACVEVIVKRAKLKTDKTVKTKENKILEWQKAAIKDGFKFPKYGADGKWGSECEAVAKKAVCKKRITYKYKNLTKIVQNAVSVAVDGLYGSKTKSAVKEYQKRNKLKADGIVGLDTWKKLLEVKK